MSYFGLHVLPTGATVKLSRPVLGNVEEFL